MAQLGRAQPFRPHLARGLVGVASVASVIAGATITERPPRRSYERRGAPKPHLSTPIVAPGGPVIPGETLTLVTAHKRPQRDWEAQRNRPHLAKPLLFVPGAPIGIGTFIEQIPDFRSVERRGAPHAHVQSPIVPPPGGAPLPGLIRSGLFPRGQNKVPQIRIPGSLVQFTAPVIPGPTIRLQSKQRPLVGRTVPHPYLTPGIIVPGGPVIAPHTILLVTTTRRPVQPRNAPHPHLPPRTLTQPAAVTPLAPAFVRYQAIQRTKIGRTIPLPHRAKPNLQPSPFRPGTFAYQSERRMHIGRTIPRPHAPAPVVPLIVPGPAPLPPAYIKSQALTRALVGRRVIQPHIAFAVKPIPLPPVDLTIYVEISGYRWNVHVGYPRWSADMGAARWESSLAPPRWFTEVNRFA